MFTMEITRLIEQCRRGDSEAPGELYKAYAQRMRGVCRRYIADEQAVEDVLHDAFVVILTSFDRLRDDSKAEAWMMSITRNMASKYKDYTAAHRMVPLEETEHRLLAEEEREQNVRGIPLDEVMKLVDKLPEGYGKVFRLSVFEGLSHREISALLGIGPHSSSSQLARAKKLLRKMMRQYWAVLLVLLIPLGIFLLRTREAEVKEREPAVAKQKPLPTPRRDRRPTEAEAPQEPIVVHLPGQDRTVVAADTIQPAVAQAVDSVGTDQTDLMAREQTAADSATTDTSGTVLRRELPRLDLVRMPRNKPASGADLRQRWSLELAYAGQFDVLKYSGQPYTYHPAPAASQPGGAPDGLDTSPAIPGSIDNWSDYAVYLANNPTAVSAKARSAVMRIALNNASRPGEDLILRSSRHRMPAVWSLALKYRLNRQFALESGLSYSRLSSDFETGSDGNAIREQQDIRYLGIPMKGIYNMYSRRAWCLYGSLGVTAEVPLGATLRSEYFVNGLYEYGETASIRAPWQFSATMGVGLQYHLTPRVGFFVEPSLRYYIPMRTDIQTYRTEHPFTFSLPLGVRFTW